MGVPKAVEHASQQLSANLDLGRFGTRHHRVAKLQSRRFLKRHEQHAVIAKSDNLGGHHSFVSCRQSASEPGLKLREPGIRLAVAKKLPCESETEPIFTLTLK
jgi:hypothetical protein